MGFVALIVAQFCRAGFYGAEFLAVTAWNAANALNGSYRRTDDGNCLRSLLHILAGSTMGA
jgi:hypothetical protein